MTFPATHHADALGEYTDYRSFRIRFIGEGPGADWSAVHDDYDGAPDANDGRLFYCSTAGECIGEIDDWHAEQALDDALLEVFDVAFVKPSAGSRL